MAVDNTASQEAMISTALVLIDTFMDSLNLHNALKCIDW